MEAQADNNNEQHVPASAVQKDATRIAKFLQPKDDPEIRFGDFNKFSAINYHAHISSPSNFNRENTLVWVVLLDVRVFERNWEVYSSGTKKQRCIADEIDQCRLYTFASVISDANTLAFFELDEPGYRANSRVGDQFAIIEPDLDVDFLTNQVPIVGSDCQLIPANLPRPYMLPEVPIDNNAAANTTSYFVLHGAKVSFEGMQLRKSYCTNGELCDFRNPTDTNCPCWQQYTLSPNEGNCVLVGDVRFTHPPHGDTNKSRKVEQWSSKYFTEFVFDHTIPAEPLKLEYDMEITTFIRDRLRSLVKYVNEKAEGKQRGWTIIGWFRRTQTTTNVNDHEIHITRIQPTFLERRDLQQAGVLLPTWCLGHAANINRVIRANEYMRMQQRP